VAVKAVADLVVAAKAAAKAVARVVGSEEAA
jgi:hypothetical protein